MAKTEALLAGQTAVVTGSSSGIGRAIALELASAGSNVLVHARQNRKGAEEVALAVQSLDRGFRVDLADLADPLEQDGFGQLQIALVGNLEIELIVRN